ncbi:MAG: endonuclease/exonuclease/phosphatase family protein [Bacteroidetes bacterium]|jgi:endonuclease/exonuclease/phosphatase family metal-dependent hydrolase|nr:endonuclease/exonuclease/phosphatase family protein [Bacteroidota bacterium]
MYRGLLAIAFILLIGGVGCETAQGPSPDAASDTVTVRVMTYNIEDVRTADVLNPDHPRLRKAAALIQRLRPDILLINEMTYDMPGGPDVKEGSAPGQNGRRFAENFLAVAQADTLEPLQYQALTPPTNTGLASGLDLDNDGRITMTYPAPAPSNPDGSPGPQSAGGRAYGNDAFGFGIFPGQYGMTLLVREGFRIDRDRVRSFRLLRWADLPDPNLPIDPATEEPWYTPDELETLRLSSKTHIDVPVTLPNGVTIHVLASHPTPPAFDGPEQRNVLRNAAEIRFWGDYLDDAAYIEDDSSQGGGLPADAPFVLMGDLNADPDEGDATEAITHHLLDHPRVQGDVTPTADSLGQTVYPDLDPDDTAQWGLRVDYVLPSENLPVQGSGVYRPVGADTAGVAVSDHFPVWLDVAVPPQP